jgi:protein-S-isoprenylcysteine O-methyltransferase Ste14
MSSLDGTLQLAALSLFLLLFAARTIHLRVTQGVRVITLVRGKPPGEAALEALFLVAFPIWIADVVVFAWPGGPPGVVSGWDPVLFDAGAVRYAGAALQLLGVALFAGSLASFGTSWRVGVDRDRPGGLVTGGVFGWSRNPIFLAMDLFLLGTVLMTGRLVPLVFAVGTAVGFHRQILAEERFLAGHYGAAYDAYRARVRRYVGQTRERRA